MLKMVKSLLFAWENWFRKQQSTICNMIPGCLQWLVWQERNNHIFEDNERSLDLLKHLLFGTLFQWACIWGPTQCISISAFYNLLAASFSSSLLYFLHIQSVHHHEHDVHFVNKSSITYPKKEEVILLFLAIIYLFCTHNHHLDTQFL